MERNLQPIDKLDETLTLLKHYNVEKHIDELWNLINSHFKANKQELDRIIIKLIKDGYLNQRQHSSGTIFYIISYEGFLFHGYREQEKLIALKNSIDALNKKRIVRNDRLLVNGTWFAGVAAMILFLWQVWIWYYPVHKDYPYWIWEKTHVSKK